MSRSAARSSPDLVRPSMGIRSGCGLNLVMLVKTGVGKSTLGNTILGREAFISKKVPTQDVAVESGDFDGFPITVHDTPRFSGTEKYEAIQQEYEEFLQKFESVPCVFLLVNKADRFTEEERRPVEKIEEVFGKTRIKKTWIRFTRGNQREEENKTINQLINDTESLKKLSQKYEGRFHVFNNKTKEPIDQVKSLMSKVFQKKRGNVSKRQNIPNSIQDNPVSSPSSRRIVLLGESGVGKSAAGNTKKKRRY